MLATLVLLILVVIAVVIAYLLAKRVTADGLWARER